jgi:hypothetical protein
MMKHIWNLFVKAGSLWVAWVNEYILKGRSFWHVKPSQACSWTWRKLLNLRDTVRGFIRFQVGDGINIFLWLDDWHLDVGLLDKYGWV